MSGQSSAETALVNKMIARIKAEPMSWARKVHGGAYSDTGEPDIDACVSGRSLKVEVKMPGARPTAIQLAALRRWERAGALAGWATSVPELEQLIACVHQRDAAVDLSHPGAP